MTITRRSFLAASASVAAVSAGLPALRTFGQAAAAGTAPKTAAAALLAAVGEKPYAELLARLAICNTNIQTRGIKTIRNVEGKFLTGYPYNEFYDWDLYFENLYLSYYGVAPYCFTNLKEFLNRQQADGYTNRSLIKQRDRQHFKPFLAQLAVLGSKQNKDDYDWLKEAPTESMKPVALANGNYYNRLKMYVDKWFSYDFDGNGLPTWNSADAAGTDNQWSRAGAIGTFEVEGVDLASYLVRELRAMTVMATHLGIKADAQAFTARADQLVKLINDNFWDEADGLYYDRHEKKKQLVKVKSATNFMPLFAGAATPERAKRMIQEHLLNEKEFWLTYPVASYAKTEPDYYQGSRAECNWRGSTWAPTNYMIFQGLMRYGYADIAKELAGRLFDMAVVKNPVLREYYNAETGGGLGQTQFWGFTALYYVMPLECLMKYDASDLDKPFQAIVPQELGVAYPS